jgi:hypothetical protein
VHTTLLVLGIVLLAQIMFHGIATVLYIVATCVIGAGVLRLASGKSIVEEAMEQAAEAAAGVELVVRPAWANIAVGMDILYVGAAALFIGALFAAPNAPMMPSSSTDAFISISVGTGVQMFAWFAHRQATRPAKRKRAFVPVMGSAS